MLKGMPNNSKQHTKIPFTVLREIKFRIAGLSIRKMLYKSFDSVLSEDEDRKLKAKLSSSVRLQMKKDSIENLRLMLSTFNTGKFKPGFEEKVLNKIRLSGYPKIILYKEMQFAFKRFVFAAILVLTFLAAFNIGEHGKINILNGEKLKLGEAIQSEYFYLPTK